MLDLGKAFGALTQTLLWVRNNFLSPALLLSFAVGCGFGASFYLGCMRGHALFLPLQPPIPMSALAATHLIDRRGAFTIIAVHRYSCSLSRSIDRYQHREDFCPSSPRRALFPRGPSYPREQVATTRCEGPWRCPPQEGEGPLPRPSGRTPLGARPSLCPGARRDCFRFL